MLAPDAALARAAFAQVAEVRKLANRNDHSPVGAVTDIGSLIERAGSGSVLECPELVDVSYGLRALVELKRWHFDRSQDAPLLWGLAEPVEIEPELLALLEKSFDATGQLSGETYTQLGELRRRVRSLKDRIRSSLEEILRGKEFNEILQERLVTERNGRFVVPVKASFRKGLGIVHDRSRTGETVYVEPAAVVELHNELGEAENELQLEEHRILSMLSRQLGRCAKPLFKSLEAAIRLDLAVARSNLGDSIKGTIPIIGEEGVILLVAGRHPVLALRGIEVVPNDLRLNSMHPALILTGPNTGGKTVALKLLGLAALMVRAGIPVPAAEGSRVDFFPEVLADIGDLQSVTGDLSTFSGHIQVVKGLLELAGPNTLLLLDEIAVGTDPAQGAALARAVLEALLERSARLVVTTHYAELKSLGLVDQRFQVAAVQYLEGRPTYRVEVGIPGSSHALAIAGRLGLSAAILERASELLDSGNRVLDEALSALEQQGGRIQAKAAELDRQEAAFKQRIAVLEIREQRLSERAARLEEEFLKELKNRLKEKEEEVRQLVASLQQNPEMRQANVVLETIRASRQNLSLEPTVSVEPEIIAIGDLVRIKAASSPGTVLQLSGERAEVLVGTLKVWSALADLTRVGKAEARKEARKNRSVLQSAPEKTPPKVRTNSNTCDLRGRRVEEALQDVEFFLDRLVQEGQPVAFILHGHGTGAVKNAVRGWLPSCGLARRFRAAEPGEGGDAFTLVELR
jgi:DNA mismatch repair protein MutS2